MHDLPYASLFLRISQPRSFQVDLDFGIVMPFPRVVRIPIRLNWDKQEKFVGVCMMNSGREDIASFLIKNQGGTKVD